MDCFITINVDSATPELDYVDEQMQWFKKNQHWLVFLYEEMYIVIREKMVVGMFNDGNDARHWAKSKFPDPYYAVFQCLPGTQVFEQ